MAFLLRPLSEHDAEDILRIDQKLGGKANSEHWENRVLYAIRRDPDASWVAENVETKKVVAYLLTDVRGEEYGLPDKTGWLEVVGVDPAFQRQDLAGQLLEKVLAYFKSQGVTDVRTLLNPQQATQAGLVSFFEKQGFQPEPLVVYLKKL